MLEPDPDACVTHKTTQLIQTCSHVLLYHHQSRRTNACSPNLAHATISTHRCACEAGRELLSAAWHDDR
jgi:hypothetical protein